MLRYLLTFVMLITIFASWIFHVWLENECQVLDKNRINMASEDQKIQLLRQKDRAIKMRYERWIKNDYSLREARSVLLTFYDRVNSKYSMKVMRYITPKHHFLTLQVQVHVPKAGLKRFLSLYPKKGFSHALAYRESREEIVLDIEYSVPYMETRV